MLEFVSVYKVMSSDIDLSRSRSLLKMFSIKNDTVGTLHSDEFFSVKNISFSLNEGDNLLILGDESSGANTIGRLIGGIIHPTEVRNYF